MIFTVYYRRPAKSQHMLAADPVLTKEIVLSSGSFARVKQVEIADDVPARRVLESVFDAMQGERWSPNGEARELIASLGLEHTSMSVGDVAEAEGGRMYQVAGCGWLEVS